MCFGGREGLKLCRSIRFFTCRDELITLGGTTSGMYSLQVYGGFMRVCRYVMAVQWIVVYF